ncbi:hypothetical protein [Bradyrhizobium guangdongense]
MSPNFQFIGHLPPSLSPTGRSAPQATTAADPILKSDLLYGECGFSNPLRAGISQARPFLISQKRQTGAPPKTIPGLNVSLDLVLSHRETIYRETAVLSALHGWKDVPLHIAYSPHRDLLERKPPNQGFLLADFKASLIHKLSNRF